MARRREMRSSWRCSGSFFQRATTPLMWVRTTFKRIFRSSAASWLAEICCVFDVSLRGMRALSGGDPSAPSGASEKVKAQGCPDSQEESNLTSHSFRKLNNTAHLPQKTNGQGHQTTSFRGGGPLLVTCAETGRKGGIHLKSRQTLAFQNSSCGADVTGNWFLRRLPVLRGSLRRALLCGDPAGLSDYPFPWPVRSDFQRVSYVHVKQ